MDLIGQIVQNWWHIPIIMAMVLVYGILLNRVLFKPVGGVLDARKKAVKEAGGLSALSRDELDRKFAEYEREVLEARRRANQVKETARAEAYAYRTGLLDQVRDEVVSETRARREELDRGREAARSELASRTAALAAQMASKVLGREVRA